MYSFTRSSDFLVVVVGQDVAVEEHAGARGFEQVFTQVGVHVEIAVFQAVAEGHFKDALGGVVGGCGDVAGLERFVVHAGSFDRLTRYRPPPDILGRLKLRPFSSPGRGL